jgi:hypothetical protein
LPVIQPGVWLDLDNESRGVLPLLHTRQTIVRPHVLSHNLTGNFS